jgi:hypothetical protein
VNKKGEVTFPSYPGMKSDKGRMEAIRSFFDSWLSSPYSHYSTGKRGYIVSAAIRIILTKSKRAKLRKVA